MFFGLLRLNVSGCCILVRKIKSQELTTINITMLKKSSSSKLRGHKMESQYQLPTRLGEHLSDQSCETAKDVNL